LPLVAGEPRSVELADGGTTMDISSAVQLTLVVPGRETGVRVRGLVVDNLFVPWLMGQNVIDMFDVVYGRPPLWVQGGRVARSSRLWQLGYQGPSWRLVRQCFWINHYGP
jgi:hypothetical protein